MRNFNFSRVVIALFALVQISCGTTYHRTSPTESGDPVLTESLFDFKERTLSEADIQRILDGRIQARDSIRLAVFNFSGSTSRYGTWRWYDEESLKSQQQLLDTLSFALSRSHRVQKVMMLPPMVTGLKPNIHQLRESAVRVQADMLLIYSLHSDIFQKYRAFKKDEAKAFATCEMVLMDIRTGLIPHTNVVTRSASTTKLQGDFTEEEMQNRVLRTATLETLLEAGNKAAAFLNEQR